MIDEFLDPEHGGFFFTGPPRGADRASEGPLRQRDPRGQRHGGDGLVRLGALTGEREFERQAEGVLRLFAGPAVNHPDGFAHLLRALDFHLAAVREVALVGDD